MWHASNLHYHQPPLGFLETIKSVQPAGRWKIVVVDSRSLKILSSACRMYDILEENVSYFSVQELVRDGIVLY